MRSARYHKHLEERYEIRDPQTSIYDYPKRDSPLERFSMRIENCKYMPWASLICDKCGKMAKKNASKLSCYSPYCQDPECIRNRKRLVFSYLKALKINSKNVVHIVFGFPHVKRFTKDIRQKHLKIINSMSKYMKKLGTPLKIVIIRDLNGSRSDLYVHYHGVNLPVKNWRLFRKNLFKARDKIGGFSIKYKHYKNRLKMFKYFSKRVAGVFQNDKDPSSFGYNKLMYIDEFFECFYNVRKLKLIGISPRAKLSVLALLLDNSSFKCPYCGHDHFKLVSNDMLDTNTLEAEALCTPPPRREHVEYVKIA